jgi:peptidoglycan/xylan/chitin deacetylase (PgdA/CDA1 family)
MNIKLPQTVINFHVINDINWMENIIVTLKKHYNFVTAKDLESYYYGNLKLKNGCHLTVDDGDKSVYEKLFPLIKKHNVPISIYVSPHSLKTGKNFWFQELSNINLKSLLDYYNILNRSKIEYVNDFQVKAFLKTLKCDSLYFLIEKYKADFGFPSIERQGMDVSQLLELKHSGLVEIGAHTQTHPILKNESYERCLYEIKSSIEDLSLILKDEVKYFAYPNGIPGIDFSEREVNFLREHGIRLGFCTENKRFSKNDHPLSIPRNGITKGNIRFILAKLLFGNSWIKIRRTIKGKQELDYRKEYLEQLD